MNFNELRKVNVNEHVEKKNGLSYLSWAWAWGYFKESYPEATYEVVKNDSGLPYFESASGVMVYTKVTAGGITHEMWLPVMDGANNAMKSNPYKYKAWDKRQQKEVDKEVAAFDMFDVNKTIMRCLVKNLAMFGLGLYIYAGEDLPEDKDEEERIKKIHQMLKQISKDNLISRQHDTWLSMKPLFKDEEEETSAWSSLDSTTRRQIKEHGAELRKGEAQEETPLSQLIAA